jgi:hypothetical protein
MALNAQSVTAQALIRARSDLARRLEVDEQQITEGLVEPTEFSDGALGAPTEDEMSAQVITPGWRIHLKADDKTYEYRASDRQLRLFNFNGENYRI